MVHPRDVLKTDLVVLRYGIINSLLYKFFQLCFKKSGGVTRCLFSSLPSITADIIMLVAPATTTMEP